MKSSKIDRIISVVVIGTCLIKAVLYGGSKPPASTNTPPDSISGDSTNDVAIIAGDLTNSVPDDASSPTNQPPPVLMASRPRLTMSAPPPFYASQSSYTSQLVTNWTTRGAFCDWLRVDFPSSFAFPSGTNLLTGVTLMAYGELRENLHCSPSPSTFTLNLPMAVSIEPDVSSVSYGLTPSNSFLFAWSNVCVNRDPTNHVDASIELFDSGACSVRFDTVETFYPAPLPEGFIGTNQDNDWLATAFPSHYAAITNGGYDAWLDDYIGYNEPNGRYKVSVTVSSLPDHGPCYLVVGPYKMVVTAPGTYSFPLEVFNEYRAYTCPTRVPLSFSYDDGYRIEEVMSFGMLAGQSNNPNNLNNPNNGPMLLGSPGVPDYYIICMVPEVYVIPSHVPLAEAVGTRLSLYCNCPSGTWDYETYLGNHLRLTFGFPSFAEIVAADAVDRVLIMMRVAGHECSGVFFIDPPSPNDDDPPHHACCNACCGDACRCDRTCCLCDCGCHSSSNSNTNTTGAVP